jgi:hypothetical protein
MKNLAKNAKARRNGKLHTREELLGALDRALEKMRRLNREEGFQTLVRAGICTPDTKLTARYGG